MLDASVCLKWFLPELGEQDVDVALDLQSQMRRGEIALVQPTVWYGEIASVLARKAPLLAQQLTTRLMNIEATIESDEACMLLAVDLSVQLHHHLFDTIYHAVALEHGIDLVTADEHYYRKARKFGHIVLLRDWRAPGEVREEPAPYRIRARKSPQRVRRKR